MRKYLLALAGLSLSLLSIPAQAQEDKGQLGVGAYIGTPFGFTAKYILDHSNALDLALGAQGSNFDMHADALTHFRDFSYQPPMGKLVPYLGLGLKIEDQDESLFGIRFVGGLAYLVKDTPLEVFAEVVPVLRLAPSLGDNLDGGVGLRYYFGKTKK